MIDIDLFQVPAAYTGQGSKHISVNGKFKDLHPSLQADILESLKKLLNNESIQDKGFKFFEILKDIFIIVFEIVESNPSIREATRHSMALQMKVLSELGEGVFIEDKNRKIIFANPSAEKILDIPSYEIFGKEFTHFIFPIEEKNRIERILTKIYDDSLLNTNSRFETQIKRKNNDLIYLLVNYGIMKTNDVLEGALITIYDISDIKKLQLTVQERSNELIQAEKMTSIGLLASGISHELNNPLAFIISNSNTIEDYLKVLLEYINDLEIFLERTRLEPKQANLLRQIKEKSAKNELEMIKKDIFEILSSNQRGLTKLADVINDLRKFSHAHKENQEQIVKVNVLEPIKLALNLLSYELKNIEVQIEYDKEHKDYYIKGNSKLYQVFLNILHNASQAINERVEAKPKGIIQIQISENNKKVIIQISDNGNGISEKNLPRIFDPFYTTKPPGVGTGLGLSISQRIINSLGGYIVAESGSILSGATFTVYLTVADEN